MTDQTQATPIRKRQRELTRSVILSAALECFDELGYFYVSIDEIVQRAGISRATFYLHFTDKGALLRELRNERLRAWSERSQVAWQANDLESLEEFFNNLVDVYSETPKLFQALHEAYAADPDFAATHRAALEDHLERMAANEPLSHLSPEQLRLALAMLYSLIENFLHRWVVGGWPLDRESAVRAMANAMLGVLR